MSLLSGISARRAEKKANQAAERMLQREQARQAKRDREAARQEALTVWIVKRLRKLPEGEWVPWSTLWNEADGAKIPKDYSTPDYWRDREPDKSAAIKIAVQRVGMLSETEPGNLRKTKGKNSRWVGHGSTTYYCRWTKEGSPPESPAAPALRRIAAASQREKEKRAAKLLRQEAQRRTHNHVRRSRELQAPGEHSTAEWLLKLEEFGHRCAYCGTEGADFHRDHLVPLVDGGSNTIGNIVPACPPCNLSKGGKSGAELLRWITDRRGVTR